MSDYHSRQTKRGDDGAWLLAKLCFIAFAIVGSWTVLYGIIRALVWVWSLFD
jgi:hypothetical protein